MDDSKTEMLAKLIEMKKELAKKQRKLEKVKRAARVKAHVRQKIKEHDEIQNLHSMHHLSENEDSANRSALLFSVKGSISTFTQEHQFNVSNSKEHAERCLATEISATGEQPQMSGIDCRTDNVLTSSKSTNSDPNTCGATGTEDVHSSVLHGTNLSIIRNLMTSAQNSKAEVNVCKYSNGEYCYGEEVESALNENLLGSPTNGLHAIKHSLSANGKKMPSENKNCYSQVNPSNQMLLRNGSNKEIITSGLAAHNDSVTSNKYKPKPSSSTSSSLKLKSESSKIQKVTTHTAKNISWFDADDFQVYNNHGSKPTKMQKRRSEPPLGNSGWLTASKDNVTDQFKHKMRQRLSDSNKNGSYQISNGILSKPRENIVLEETADSLDLLKKGLSKKNSANEENKSSGRTDNMKLADTDSDIILEPKVSTEKLKHEITMKCKEVNSEYLLGEMSVVCDEDIDVQEKKVSFQPLSVSEKETLHRNSGKHNMTQEDIKNFQISHKPWYGSVVDHMTKLAQTRTRESLVAKHQVEENSPKENDREGNENISKKIVLKTDKNRTLRTTSSESDEDLVKASQMTGGKIPQNCTLENTKLTSPCESVDSEKKMLSLTPSFQMSAGSLGKSTIPDDQQIRDQNSVGNPVTDSEFFSILGISEEFVKEPELEQQNNSILSDFGSLQKTRCSEKSIHDIEIMNTENHENKEPCLSLRAGHAQINNDSEATSSSILISKQKHPLNEPEQLYSGDKDECCPIEKDAGSIEGTENSSRADTFSEYTELDAIPYSQFELAEDFLSEEINSYSSQSDVGNKMTRKKFSALVKRRSPRISLLTDGNSHPSNSGKSNMARKSKLLVHSVGGSKRRWSLVQQKQSAAILSIFQFLIDEAKKQETHKEFELPVAFHDEKDTKPKTCCYQQWDITPDCSERHSENKSSSFSVPVHTNNFTDKKMAQHSRSEWQSTAAMKQNDHSAQNHNDLTEITSGNSNVDLQFNQRKYDIIPISCPKKQADNINVLLEESREDCEDVFKVSHVTTNSDRKNKDENQMGEKDKINGINMMPALPLSEGDVKIGILSNEHNFQEEIPDQFPGDTNLKCQVLSVNSQSTCVTDEEIALDVSHREIHIEKIQDSPVGKVQIGSLTSPSAVYHSPEFTDTSRASPSTPLRSKRRLKLGVKFGRKLFSHTLGRSVTKKNMYTARMSENEPFPVFEEDNPKRGVSVDGMKLHEVISSSSLKMVKNELPPEVPMQHNALASQAGQSDTSSFVCETPSTPKMVVPVPPPPTDAVDVIMPDYLQIGSPIGDIADSSKMTMNLFSPSTTGIESPSPRLPSSTSKGISFTSTPKTDETRSKRVTSRLVFNSPLLKEDADSLFKHSSSHFDHPGAQNDEELFLQDLISVGHKNVGESNTSKNLSQILNSEESYLSPGQLQVSIEDLEVGDSHLPQNDSVSCGEKGEISQVSFLTNLSHNTVSAPASSPPSLTNVITPWKKVPRTPTTPVQVLEEENSKDPNGVFTFTPGRSKAKSVSSHARHKRGRNDKVWKFSGCFQSSTQDAIVSILTGDIMTKENERAQFIVSVHATSLTLWTKDNEQGGWTTELDWRLAPEIHVMQACLIPRSDITAVAASGWNGSQAFVTMFIYDWHTEDTMRYNIPGVDQAMDMRFPIDIELCPYLASELLLGITTATHHTITKVHFSESLKSVLSVSSFGVHLGKLVSLVAVVDQPCASIGLCGDQRITIWNTKLETSVKKITMPLKLPCLTGLHGARSVKGYLVMDVSWRVDDGDCGGVIVVNPLTGQTRQIAKFPVPNLTWRKVERARKDNGLMTAVSGRGNVGIWNSNSGALLGFTKCIMSTSAAVFSKTKDLIVGEIHGCLHIYTAPDAQC